MKHFRFFITFFALLSISSLCFSEAIVQMPKKIPKIVEDEYAIRWLTDPEYCLNYMYKKKSKQLLKNKLKNQKVILDIKMLLGSWIRTDRDLTKWKNPKFNSHELSEGSFLNFIEDTNNQIMCYGANYSYNPLNQGVGYYQDGCIFGNVKKINVQENPASNLNKCFYISDDNNNDDESDDLLYISFIDENTVKVCEADGAHLGGNRCSFNGIYARKQFDQKARLLDENNLVGAWAHADNTSSKIKKKEFYFNYQLFFSRGFDEITAWHAIFQHKPEDLNLYRLSSSNYYGRINTRTSKDQDQILDKCFYLDEYTYIRFINQDTFEVFKNQRENTISDSTIGGDAMRTGIYHRIKE